MDGRVNVPERYAMDCPMIVLVPPHSVYRISRILKCFMPSCGITVTATVC